jgi:hypothetical protein
MSETQEPKTMEEILAEVAALKAQNAALRNPAVALLDGTKVVLNAAAHKKLSQSKAGGRARDKDIVGEVIGFEQRQHRVKVMWPSKNIEHIAREYLEVVA